MTEKQKNKIKKRFKDIKFKKIVLYKNPNEFNKIYIERVNPDHVGIIWGRRRKNLNKGKNYIKLGKVYFEILPVMVGLSTCAYIDLLTSYTYNLLINIGIIGIMTTSAISLMLYYLPFKIGSAKKCSESYSL